MKKSLHCVVMALLTLLFADAGAASFEGSAEIGLFSQDVDRGAVLNDRAVLFPQVDVSADFGLRAGVFGVVDMTDRNGRRRELTLVEGLLAYTLPLPGPVHIEAGYVPRFFPGSDADPEHEAFLSLALNAPLTPALTAHVDVEDAASMYLELGFGRGFSMGEGVDLDLGAGLGAGTSVYNRATFDVDRAALNDLTLSAELAFSLTDNLTLSVTGRLMHLPDRDIRRGARGLYADDRALFVGTTLHGRF